MSEQLTDEEIERAMVSARIPKKYRGKLHSLNAYGIAGTAAKNWIDAKGGTELAAGKGRFLVTVHPKLDGMGFYYTMARAVLLHGISTLVVSLPTLIDSMYDEEMLEKMRDTTALFLGGFYIDGYESKPFSNETQNRLEWMISDRIRNQQSMVFQSTSKVMSCNWWSGWFLQLVSIHVGEEILI